VRHERIEFTLGAPCSLSHADGRGRQA